jgi:hypothetical protein
MSRRTTNLRLSWRILIPAVVDLGSRIDVGSEVWACSRSGWRSGGGSPRVPWVGGTIGSVGLGGRRDDHDPAERVKDVGGPRPSGGDAEVASPAAAGEPGGHVQYPEAQQLRLSLGEVAVEGERLERGDEVCGDRGELHSCLVDGVLAGGEPRPLSLAALIRSSTRAWARCRASRKASCPMRVLVAKAW